MNNATPGPEIPLSSAAQSRRLSYTGVIPSTWGYNRGGRLKNAALPTPKQTNSQPQLACRAPMGESRRNFHPQTIWEL